jgi:uncharacterized membrane protein
MVLVPIVAVTLLMGVFANPNISTIFSNVMAALPIRYDSQKDDIRAMGLPDGCLTPVVMAAAVDLTGVPEMASKRSDQTCADCHSLTTADSSGLSHSMQKNCSECHQTTPEHGRPLPIDATHYHCCTSCHSVGKKLPMGSMEKLTAACKTCHQ